MPREWQQKRYKQFVLPDAVYFQCVWAVRDLYRMEQRIEELEHRESADYYSPLSISDQSMHYGDDELEKEDQETELSALKYRVGVIREALDDVPEEYHANILGNIILRMPSRTYHGKMWKYWKQRFLYIVAKKFAMI